MTRNLKILGLALVAAFAMSAVVASAASAQTNGKLTAPQPFTLIGHQEGEVGSNAFTAKFGETNSKVECANATYTYHKYDVTPHTLIPSGESTITRTPHLSGCSADGLPATVDMNGCDYALHILETTGGGDTYGVTMTIICPLEKHIQITIFSSGTHSLKVCTVTITEKAAGYTGLHIRDNTNGKLTLLGSMEGLKAEKSGLCGTPVDENAKWDILSSEEGRNGEGKAVAVSISH